MTRLPKVGAAIAAALMMSATLTACGGNEPASTDSSMLKVWIMGDDGSKFEQLVEDFTKSSKIEVDVDAIPWDNVHEKLTTAVASGNGPDVMQIGLSHLPTAVDAGALADLTSVINAHPNLAADKFLDAVAPDKLNPAGKTLSVPWISDTRVLFYRTDILTEQGLSGPPATWEQLREYATKLAARGKGQYGYYIPQWDAPLPAQFTWQAGGDVVDASGKINLNTPEFKRAADFYLSFYSDKLVPTASDFDQTQGFISGAAPMLISGPYLATAIKEQAPELAGKWAVAPLPSDKTGTALYAGSNLGVFSKSTNIEASVKLLNYLADPATQLRWYTLNGELPAVKAALNDPTLTGEPTVKVYVQQLTNAKLLPVTAAWDPIGQKMLAALNEIALKGANPDATLAKLHQDVNDLQK
ncbi:extracellular solute-binding protein [Micromonospora thermarum]|uniref:Extracellular solute-binding protein n=1 Tax=Micromonospora thermarum TaxID=2720024 RepID=A0ABX0ZHP2_9ACTN|nr:extracellular solute-binding protein [Micromonospora thermarum]NJP35385.1 extracellular solute-binding protein [Micromonospora thermarum]